jgi:hypothetical protein
VKSFIATRICEHKIKKDETEWSYRACNKHRTAKITKETDHLRDPGKDGRILSRMRGWRDKLNGFSIRLLVLLAFLYN